MPDAPDTSNKVAKSENDSSKKGRKRTRVPPGEERKKEVPGGILGPKELQRLLTGPLAPSRMVDLGRKDRRAVEAALGRKLAPGESAQRFSVEPTSEEERRHKEAGENLVSDAKPRAIEGLRQEALLVPGMGPEWVLDVVTAGDEDVQMSQAAEDRASYYERLLKETAGSVGWHKDPHAEPGAEAAFMFQRWLAAIQAGLSARHPGVRIVVWMEPYGPGLLVGGPVGPALRAGREAEAERREAKRRKEEKRAGGGRRKDRKKRAEGERKT